METLLAELKKQLLDQRTELGTQIKNSEEALIRTKEGFLKVEGALELINILETKIEEQQKQTDEVVEEVIGSS
jgi:septal ring factor EnvC (AmiA/AmiB activator)